MATLSFIDEGERAKFLDLRRREGEPSLHLRGERASLPFIFDVTVANLPRFTGLKVF